MTAVWRVDRYHLYPPFRDAVESFLDRSPYAWYVLDGYRSHATQAAHYGQGRTREQMRRAGLDEGLARPSADRITDAQPGQSAHQYGLAVDVVLDTDPRDGLQPSWDIRLGGWVWLRVAVWLTADLSAGSLWKKRDWPHLEMLDWKAHRTAAAEWQRRRLEGRAA